MPLEGESKGALRARMLEQRSLLAPEDAAGCGKAAQIHMLASPHWDCVRTVVLYMPIRCEVDTGLLLSRARAEGKRVLLPRCVAGQRGMLELVACAGAADCLPGAYGILEPRSSLPAVDPDDPEQAPQLVVAPGLAVDRLGYRLGYGGGYYDRLLRRPGLRASVCIALMYAVQRVHSLPADSWDARVQGVCTEEGLVWI